MSGGSESGIIVAAISAAIGAVGLAAKAFAERWRPRTDRMIEVSGQVVERLNGEAQTLHESLAELRSEFEAYRVQVTAEMAEMQESLNIMGSRIREWRVAAYRSRGAAREALGDPDWTPDGWPRED